MRKLVVSLFCSLDGVVEDPDRFMTSWDPEVDAFGDEGIASPDTVILGRRTYDSWSDYWPTSDIEPFAGFINNVEKYVATSTPLGGQWHNSSPITGPLPDFVRDLKARPGGDIGVHASISVAQALFTAGVVDEIRLSTAPVVAGTGRRLFEGAAPAGLELLAADTSSSGYLLLTYRVPTGADHD